MKAKQKLKIAFVSDTIYPYNKGGKETRSYELAKNLSKNKENEVHFYTMKFWDGDKVIKKDGFYLHGIAKARPMYTDNRRSIKQGILFGFAAFRLFNEDFDVIDGDHMVYFHLFPLKIISLIKRKRFIITWHEVWGKDYWMKYLGKKGIIGYWMEKMSSKLPDRIISISDHTANNLIKNLNVKKEKIVTITNGIEFDHIQDIKPSSEKSDIIFAGGLMNHKNVDVLLKAVSIIKKTKPDVKCIIVGGGPEKDDLQLLAENLDLEKNIIFKGLVENSDDVLALMKSSNAFVLPSSREGFGITVIEANACALPVITVNEKDNASKDLITDGKNGYISKLDEKDLADNILKVIKQTDKMKNEMKNASLAFAKKYDWKNIIKKFEEVYRG